MKVKAIVPWYGSKRTIAPEIVREIGPHRCYWEPFCGSMAVLLAKPKATMETVNDLHGDLINLARHIQDRAAAPALYRRLRRVWFCQDFLPESKAFLDGRPPDVRDVGRLAEGVSVQPLTGGSDGVSRERLACGPGGGAEPPE